LPSRRIQRAHELGEIAFEEDPALARLGTGDQAALGARAHFLWVHMQEGGGFIEGECPYGAARWFALYKKR
jgi:hypothetical protein